MQVFEMTGCGNSNDSKTGNNSGSGETKTSSDIKIGLICLHDENSTYDLSFINSVQEVKKKLGL